MSAQWVFLAGGSATASVLLAYAVWRMRQNEAAIVPGVFLIPAVGALTYALGRLCGFAP